MIIILLLLALRAPEAIADNDDVLLKARYIAVKGTDPEYGKEAIERNELPHHPLPHLQWLILVETPGDPAEWQAKLNASVDPRYGSFIVECASAEEEKAVREGRIRMRRSEWVRVYDGALPSRRLARRRPAAGVTANVGSLAGSAA
jgi:hypothetical protein